jgi:hypothetical protein
MMVWKTGWRLAADEGCELVGFFILNCVTLLRFFFAPKPATGANWVVGYCGFGLEKDYTHEHGYSAFDDERAIF